MIIFVFTRKSWAHSSLKIVIIIPYWDILVISFFFFFNKSLTLNTKLDHGQLRHDVYYPGRLGIKTIWFSCRARHDPALCVTWAGEVEEEGMVWAQVSLSCKVKERCELQASLSYRVRLSKTKQNKTKSVGIGYITPKSICFLPTLPY